MESSEIARAAPVHQSLRGCCIGRVDGGDELAGPQRAHAVAQLVVGGVLRVGDAVDRDVALLAHIHAPLLERPSCTGTADIIGRHRPTLGNGMRQRTTDSLSPRQSMVFAGERQESGTLVVGFSPMAAHHTSKHEDNGPCRAGSLSPTRLDGVVTCWPEGNHVRPLRASDALPQSLWQEDLAHEADMDAGSVPVLGHQLQIRLR